MDDYSSFWFHQVSQQWPGWGLGSKRGACHQGWRRRRCHFRRSRRWRKRSLPLIKPDNNYYKKNMKSLHEIYKNINIANNMIAIEKNDGFWLCKNNQGRCPVLIIEELKYRLSVISRLYVSSIFFTYLS